MPCFLKFPSCFIFLPYLIENTTYRELEIASYSPGAFFSGLNQQTGKETGLKIKEKAF